jgi:hypothetical protein
MSAAVERLFADAVAWARTELSHADFGEVRLAFIVHGGRLARIEKSLTLKEQPIEQDGGRTP